MCGTCLQSEYDRIGAFNAAVSRKGDEGMSDLSSKTLGIMAIIYILAGIALGRCTVPGIETAAIVGVDADAGIVSLEYAGQTHEFEYNVK